tara:strand:- start:1010 stop:1747 length:738 start_codon:yes stop_codon:yes gene_type:complete
MSLKYPLIFNSEDELVKHIQEHSNFYEKVLNLNLNNKHKKLIDLHTNINKTSSYYKGEFNEQLLQEVISNKFTDWNIDETKKMKCMDIRLHHKTLNLSIGIECKNKQTITKNDLTKFISDKSSNQFNGNIFISNSHIPPFLKIQNSCTVINDDLYIYSQEIPTIINYLEVYLCKICEKNKNEEENEEEKINIEDIHTLFNNHNLQKQQLLKQDKVFLQLIRNESLLKNHLYITTKSKCKSNKPPY